MAILTIPNSFSAGTAAVASQVNANFTAVKSFVEALSSGTNIDAGAVTAAKLDSSVTNLFVPVGGLVQFAGATAPAGGKWMLADGSAISRSSYSALFALVGTTYGVGDGSTTFNLPNLKGRVPVGLDATQTEFDALGETGGVKSVTLTEAQIPSHNHTQNSHNHTQDSHNHTQNSHNHTQAPHSHLVNGTLVSSTSHQHNNLNDYLSTGTNGGSLNGSQSPNAIVATAATNQSETATNNATTATNQATTATNNPTGGGTAHDNLQPYVVVNYLIRVA